ncbi:MAG: MarR family transcriptional regulator [Clostridia bacterium]|nr:MarR family transcriptional regulator [Clostridia bacterium]
MDEKNYEVLKLENQLCFPLYAAARETVKLYRPFLDELNLTYTQYIALMVLWEEGAVSVKELGDKLYLDSGTLTPLLKSMESKGLVKRARSEKDERRLIVTLTEEGERLKEKAVEVPLKIAGCFDLSEEEAAFLYIILRKMLNNSGKR